MVGWWSKSPIGPLRDVMWARPDGERVLLVDRPEAAAFITAVYQFDRVIEGPIEGAIGGGWLRLDAGVVSLDLRAGPGWRLPFSRLRPPSFTRWIEGPIARRIMGVTTFGTSPSGVREWYRADEYRPLAGASAIVDGRDVGPLVPFSQPARFGFSEPPRRPAMVKVRPLLEDPSGRLDGVIASDVLPAGDPAASRPPTLRTCWSLLVAGRDRLAEFGDQKGPRNDVDAVLGSQGLRSG